MLLVIDNQLLTKPHHIKTCDCQNAAVGIYDFMFLGCIFLVSL